MPSTGAAVRRCSKLSRRRRSSPSAKRRDDGLQRLAPDLVDAERAGDRAEQQIRIVHRRELDEECSVGEGECGLAGGFDREPGLS